MKILIKIYNYTQPMLVFVLELFLSFKLMYCVNTKLKLDIFKEIMDIIFIIYIVFLFNIVTIPEYNYQIINLKPFKEIFRYEIGSKLFIQNVIGNIMLFIPYSFYISYCFKIDKLYLILLFTFLLSLTIELIQTKIGRVFDIDDIILNIVSGIIGYFMYRVCKK